MPLAFVFALGYFILMLWQMDNIRDGFQSVAVMLSGYHEEFFGRTMYSWVLVTRDLVTEGISVVVVPVILALLTTALIGNENVSQWESDLDM